MRPNEVNNYEGLNVLKKRYIFALVIIAGILIVSQGIIQFAVYTQSGDSRIVNLAGRQRMLSQRITKCVLEFDYEQKSQDREKLIRELDQSIILWEKSNNGLQLGDRDLGLPRIKSEAAKAMFAEIEGNFQIILDSAKQVSHLVKNGELNKNDFNIYLNRILGNEDKFLAGMDKIVFQFDLEASRKVTFLSIVEIILLIFALIVLSLEAIFIFRPAELQIRKSMDVLVGNEDNIRKLFDIAPNPMFLVNPKDYSIVQLNQMALDTIRLSSEEAIGRKLYDFVASDYLKPLDIIEEKKYFGQIKKMEVVLRDVFGTSYFMLMSTARITFYSEIIYLIGFSDYTDLKKKEEKLERFATIDEMTGLINRRTGLAILQKEIERCKREINQLTLCFIDLDGLKRVNDEFGHIEGDWFIKTVAHLLNQNARTEDTVFRYGGDEILILFPQCDEEKGRFILERIMGDLSKVNAKSGKPFEIDLSYGLSTYSCNKNILLEDLISKADENMYKQKVGKKLMKNRGK